MVTKLGKLQRGWQKSKHWCWVGPQPCTIFCFMLIHHAWLTRPKHFYRLIVQYVQECVCFVQGHGWKKWTKGESNGFHNHSTLLTTTSHRQILLAALYNDKKHEITSLGCNLHPTLGPLLKFIYLPFFLIYQQFAHFVHSSKYGKVSSRNQWACSWGHLSFFSQCNILFPH